MALEKRNGQPQDRSAVGVDRIRWWTQWDREILSTVVGTHKALNKL